VRSGSTCVKSCTTSENCVSVFLESTHLRCDVLYDYTQVWDQSIASSTQVCTATKPSMVTNSFSTAICISLALET
jgi:hypothetical protein